MGNCNDKFEDNPFPKVSAKAVVWYGEDIPCLNICKGESVDEIINIIGKKFCEVLDDLDLNEIELCPELVTLLNGRDKNLANIVQILVDNNCNLSTLVEDVRKVLGDTNKLVLDIKCLRDRLDEDNCNTYNTFILRDILQLIIDDHCDLKTQFLDFKSSIFTEIQNIVNQEISNLTQNIFALLPKGSIIGYDGPISNFDASGLGKPGTEVANYAICNGANGTQDYRGFGLVMATTGVGGGTLDPLISSYNYTVNSKIGKPTVTLSTANLPPHNHPVSVTVNDPGHEHSILKTDVLGTFQIYQGNGAGIYFSLNNNTTSNDITNITVSASTSNVGNSNPIDVRNPDKVTVFIKKIA